MSVKEMDKATVKALAAEMEAALKAVAEKNGVTIKFGGGKYDPTAGTFNPKVTVELPDAKKREFEAYCGIYGLEPEDFGKSFTVGGKTFTVSGLASGRSSKYPILAMNSNGKEFKFTVEQARKVLGRA